jgi:hypothetical protein
MGMSNEIREVREKTCETLREEFAKQERAFQVAWRKAGNEDYAKYRPVTPSEISRIVAYYGAPKNKRIKPKRDSSTAHNSSPNPPAELKELPGPKRDPEAVFVLLAPLGITILSVALTIVGLYVFAAWAGIILGSMFALFLVTTVFVARNRMKGDTSGKALETVGWLEAGAAVLHIFTFYRLLPDFGEEWMPAKIVVCIALAGFAAYLSYSAVLTVRNYNAEIQTSNSQANEQRN